MHGGGFGGGFHGPPGHMHGGPPPGGLRGSIDEDETLGRIYDREVVARLLKYLGRYKRWVIVGVISVLIFTLTSVAQPWLIGAAVNAITSGVNAQLDANTEAIARHSRELTIIFAVFIGNGLLSWVGSYWQRMSEAYAGQGILLTLRTQMFEHLQKLSLSFYDRNEVGRIMSRVQNDVLALQELSTAGVLALIGDAVSLGGVIFSLFAMNWQLALITLTVIPLLGITLIIWQKYARQAFIRVRQAIAVVNAELQENISGVRVIQSLSREDTNMRLFDNVNEANLGANLQATRLRALMQPMTEILMALATALVIIFGGAQVLRGELSIGALVAFTLFVQRFFQPIRELTMLYAELQRAMAAGVRIFEVLDTKPEVEDAPDAVELPPVKGEVRFDHVDFEYLPGVKVLHDINLRIQPGETIAFVGQTGAGKSTMANLIARFYDVTSGSITIDGSDIRGVKRESLTRQIAMVLQDPFLFSATIKDNIRYGRLDATDDEIVAAAKAVGAHDFIMRLEKGYDTEMQERGSNLSVGQRQLVSFARAVLADPRILILDEATANVDTQTEILIQEALRHLLRGRTSFVIAHRISTTRDADRVVVMDDGHIAEMGSHEELLANGGLYMNLYTMSYASVESTAS